MDSTKRTLIKALFWQGLGLISMIFVGYLFTGSLRAGGLMAVANTAIGLSTYVMYERLWARIGWGRGNV